MWSSKIKRTPKNITNYYIVITSYRKLTVTKMIKWFLLAILYFLNNIQSTIHSKNPPKYLTKFGPKFILRPKLISNYKRLFEFQSCRCSCTAEYRCCQCLVINLSSLAHWQSNQVCEAMTNDAAAQSQAIKTHDWWIPLSMPTSKQPQTNNFIINLLLEHTFISSPLHFPNTPAP